MKPSNFRNDGRAWEATVEAILTQYTARGLLRLRKVEPPTRTIGGKGFRKVIYLPNPFLDYVGAWTEAGGRAVFMEAKSTSEDRLPMGGSGGLSAGQVENLFNWTNAGAVAFVLWEAPAGVVFIRAESVRSAFVKNRKSLAPDDGVPVKAGVGFVVWDFLAVMRETYHVNPSPREIRRD
jgi:penicillin-binding protein-related factor A (putative recombinase)